ncbi:hypothetical protein OG389_28015 [Streptomyces sp. NBC_00435]|uniref:hypothetical protein n=1 Tax=Streptomyces sp. NBC_00435 TaxID=2903649 RepID=UPI002E23AB8C
MTLVHVHGHDQVFAGGEAGGEECELAAAVLVARGTGYVAGWCVTRLLEQGYDVRITVRAPARDGALRVLRAAGERLTTVLPGAVFGPLLHHSHRGSAQIVESLLGACPERPGSGSRSSTSVTSPTCTSGP